MTMSTGPQRPQFDEEYSQARARVGISTCALAIILGCYWFLPSASTSAVLVSAAVVAGYCVFSVAWAVLV
jgi:hypothetical protein